MSAQDFCEVPSLGAANKPDAEMRLLLGEMDRVLGPVKGRLIDLGITFDQALAIYNDIPVSATAADLDEAELREIINRHLESA